MSENANASLRQSLVASVTRCYPFYSGCANFANSQLVRRLAGAGPTGERLWVGAKGGEVSVALNDYVGRAVFFTGDLDPKLSWVCKRIVRPGDTVLDVGANIGVMSVLLSRLVGPSGRVHAFEPNPLLVDVLRQTRERNRMDNLVLHPVALGESPGSLELCTPPGNDGRGSLVHHKGMQAAVRHRVDVVTLSSVIEEQGIRSIRLMKMDVEGFEPHVLKGARRMFETARPDAILFEHNAWSANGDKVDSVVDILRGWDYGLFTIPRRLLRMRLQRVEPAADLHASHDLLAVPLGAKYEEIASLIGAGR